MKTEQELNDDILKITLVINEKFPELTKFIEEMPVTIPNSKTPEINIIQLENYYHSLMTMVSEYSETHQPIPLEES
ncbi:MAG: hypothetical protein ABI761_02550 [Saprospiraceae bacterium]